MISQQFRRISRQKIIQRVAVADSEFQNNKMNTGTGLFCQSRQKQFHEIFSFLVHNKIMKHKLSQLPDMVVGQ